MDLFWGWWDAGGVLIFFSFSADIIIDGGLPR